MIIPSGRARVLAAALMAWTACAAAQQSTAGPVVDPAAPPMTLPQTIALALERHPLLRAAGHEVAAGTADLAQAGRLPNPELSWLREGEQAGARTTTVQINQPIELGGKRRARIAVAEGALALADTELALRRQAIRADAIDAYYAVLAAEERRQLAEEGARLAARSTGAASSRVAAGKVAPLEAARARLAQAEAQLETERAGADLAIARASLAQLVGPAGAAQSLAPSGADALPEAESLEGLLGRAEGAAEVRRARARVTLRRAETGVEQAARIPDLTLSVGSQRDDQAGRRQAVLGVAVPLPLFDRNSGRIAAARERGQQAEAELEAARLSASSQLAAAHARYVQARSEAQLLERELAPQARSVYELTLKGFDYGKFGFIEVLDAQRGWVQASARGRQAVRDAWRARAELERLAGPAPTNTKETP